MRSIWPTTILITAVASILAAQNSRARPPFTIPDNTVATGEMGLTSGESQLASPKPFFCPANSCLYYAGNNDTTDPGTNGLFDINNSGTGVWANVWVGVKPANNAIIAGVSGNYYNNATGIGTNPTPFTVRIGLSSGEGGRVVCNTRGSATFAAYGEPWSGLNSDNYRIKRLKQGCRVKKGQTYFMLLEPQYNDPSTVGYLEDDNGQHAHRRGWRELVDDSFFTWEEPPFYQPTWGSSGVCGGIGCDGFSMSLTGKQD